MFWRSCFDPILESCRARRKRLYVHAEINASQPQMEHVFLGKLRLEITTRDNGLCCCCARLNEEDQCTSMLHFIRLRCHMRAFRRNSVPSKKTQLPAHTHTQTRKVCLTCFGGCFRAFPKHAWWVCKHFGLEPWWEMMRRKLLPEADWLISREII